MRDGKNLGEMLLDGSFDKLADLSPVITGIKALNLLCASLWLAGNNRGLLEWRQTRHASPENCEDVMFRMGM